MQNSNCALDEDSAGVTIVGSRTNLGVPALTNLLPQTSLNVATRSQELTQLAVADSKEKKIRAFSGLFLFRLASDDVKLVLNNDSIPGYGHTHVHKDWKILCRTQALLRE